MRLLKILLPVLMLLTGSVMALADYNPTNPAEPGTPKVPHELTLTLSTPGVATLYGAGTYTEGTRQRVYVSNIKTYYQFVNWTDQDGEVVSTSSDFYYVMPDKKVTLTANFTYNFTYNPSNPAEPGTPHVPRKLTLTSSHPGAATLYGAGTYNEGSSQRVYLSNVQNYYTFVNWTDDEGTVVSTSRDFQYVMPDRNVTLTANFTYDYTYNPSNPAEPGTPHVPRKLTLTSNYPGAATLYGAGTYNEGTTQRVYLSNVQNYYTFVNWTNEIDSVVSTSRDFQFVIPSRNVTLTANFTYDYVYDPANPAEPGTPAPAESVADNMVNFPRFGMYDDTHVMILCETPGSTIYYTLDGTDPTKQGSVYTAPIYVSGNILVKAVAMKEGMENSPIRSYQVSTYKTAAPKFTFVNKKIEISCDTEGAVIRYVVGISDPDQGSTVYTAPLEPADNYQIRAYASKEGLSDSNITTYLHRIADYSMAAPTFSLDESGRLVITSAVEGSSIHYTTDGTDPTSESTTYTVPITLNGNCTVKAYATHVNYYDSPVGEYRAEGFKVERPSFSFLNPKLSFSTTTPEAQIRYTMDGSIPTDESTLYTDTLQLKEDCHVVARGFKNNYEPSDTISFRYVYKNYQLPTPTASIANKKLVLKCSDQQARIRYSTNSQAALADFVQYSDSVALSNDCTIRFYATRENYNDSPMDSIIFKKSEHQVAKPAISYNPDTKVVSITTATTDAQIRYTTDGTVPTATTGTVYGEPFTVEGNLTITAVAFRNDLFDSEPNEYVIDSQKVPTPTASFANRQLTLRCDDEAAQIHYSTDANAVKEAFAVYVSPIDLTEDCTVRFYAKSDRFNDSDMDSFEFKKSEYQETIAEISKDYRQRTIAVVAPDCRVEITIDGNRTEHASPATIEVNSDMTSVRIVALARNPDRYDSEPITETLVFHLPPVIDYDGHTITARVNDNDPAKNNGKVKANFNDMEFSDNQLVDGMGSVTATVESDRAFVSDQTVMPIDFFNTGIKAGARNGHNLSEAFAGWQSETGYPQLTIVGEINREDLEYLAGIDELTTLSLDPDRITDESFDSALEGSRIETVYLKESREGLLKGMPRLTSVIWRNEESALEQTTFGNPMNPNMLVWVADKSLAPAEVRNIVTSNRIEADPATITEGHADSIILTDGDPYNAHNPIEADHIEFRKQFSQVTEPEVCRGWETIALPFAPTDIRHKDKGPVLPHAAWEENNPDGVFDDNGPKPFWIYEATEDDWKPAAEMKAGVPYIISMPNNPGYIESYNIAGEITFSADNVRLGDNGDTPFPYVSDWISGMSLHATFMPVEEDHLSLNSEWTAAIDGILPGSVFTAEAGTLPFEAYLTGAPQNRIPLFGGDSDGVLPTLAGISDIRIEVIGQNSLRLTSPRNSRVDIHTTTGAMVRSVNLTPSESITVTGLTPGIYLVAGRKLLIR